MTRGNPSITCDELVMNPINVTLRDGLISIRNPRGPGQGWTPPCRFAIPTSGRFHPVTHVSAHCDLKPNKLTECLECISPCQERMPLGRESRWPRRPALLPMFHRTYRILADVARVSRKRKERGRVVMPRCTHDMRLLSHLSNATQPSVTLPPSKHTRCL